MFWCALSGPFLFCFSLLGLHNTGFFTLLGLRQLTNATINSKANNIPQSTSSTSNKKNISNASPAPRVCVPAVNSDAIASIMPAINEKIASNSAAINSSIINYTRRPRKAKGPEYPACACYTLLPFKKYPDAINCVCNFVWPIIFVCANRKNCLLRVNGNLKWNSATN